MEGVKVPVNGKSLKLPNGVELTYCEFGEENEEVIICAQYYFITFTPWLQAMAKRYHVYGLVMRFDTENMTEFTDDGAPWLNHQWTEDIHDFALALGIKKFTYVGKCHGSFVGWTLCQKYPEMLDAFVSVSMIPAAMRLAPGAKFAKVFTIDRPVLGELDFLQKTTRKQENIPIKVEEGKTLGDVNKVLGMPHQFPFDELDNWDDVLAACKQFTVPQILIYGTEDPGYSDWKDHIYRMSAEIPGFQLVTLQGQKHFFEIDIPERLADVIVGTLENIKIGDK